MKQILFLSFSLLVFSVSKAQMVKNHKDSCTCLATAQVKFPEIGDEDSLKYGKVLASFEIDSNCVYGNVKIEQTLSPRHDAAVQKAMSDFITRLNRCKIICTFKNCSKQKWFLPFNFSSPDD